MHSDRERVEERVSNESAVWTKGRAVLTVKGWRDAVVEERGFPVLSPYVEAVWLPVLGPSATLALRRLGALAAARPEGVDVDLGDLARDLGLGGATARLLRTLRRLEMFGMATSRVDHLAVRTAVGPLPERHLCRLSQRARAAHEHFVGRSSRR